MKEQMPNSSDKHKIVTSKTGAIVLWPDEWYEPGAFKATSFRWYVMRSSIPSGADPTTARPALGTDFIQDGNGDYITSRYSPDLVRAVRSLGISEPIYRVTLVRVQERFSITLVDG